MNKIVLSLCSIVFFTVLTVSALDISFSEQGLGMDANAVKKGNNVYVKYAINGLDSPQAQVNMPADTGMPQVSKMKIDMVMNCSTKQMKINSMDLLGVDGSIIHNISNTEWFPIEKQDDLQKLKEMCTSL